MRGLIPWVDRIGAGEGLDALGLDALGLDALGLDETFGVEREDRDEPVLRETLDRDGAERGGAERAAEPLDFEAEELDFELLVALSLLWAGRSWGASSRAPNTAAHPRARALFQ